MTFDVARRGRQANQSGGGRGRIIPRRSLFMRLKAGERVTLVSAPAGSGKSTLVRSWFAHEGLVERIAWVTVGRGHFDSQTFWLSVVHAFRSTYSGAQSVRDFTPTPDLSGWGMLNRLLDDLSQLTDKTWLVIDDLHELNETDLIQELEQFIKDAPASLRLVLLSRNDPKLGLHRLRLEGDLTEIRQDELRFSVAEARALLDAAGISVSDDALKVLVDVTEGWAAGLRLAVLSMSRHPDPEGFAISFSGRARAVEQYLFAEVLDRQPDEVRRLLLRTSILERVSGALADRITDSFRSEQILTELEDTGAFVQSLDPERTWFRYHRLFADMLSLELRRTASRDEIAQLHNTASEWFAEQGYPVDAIRHAQAATNWSLAARLLADHWFGICLDGRMGAIRELLSSFPTATVAKDPELAIVFATDARKRGALDDAKQHLDLASQAAEAVPSDNRHRFLLSLLSGRLAVARARNDVVGAAAEEAQLRDTVTQSERIEVSRGDAQVLMVALLELGIAELWTGQLDSASQHLERARAEARRVDRPFQELQAVANLSAVAWMRSQASAEGLAREALKVANRSGWEDKSLTSVASLVLGAVMLWRARLEESEQLLDEAKKGLEIDAHPPTALMLYAAHGLLNFVRGSYEAAAAAYRAIELIEQGLVTPHPIAIRARAMHLKMLIRLGETDRAERALAEMPVSARETPEIRLVQAALKLALGDPQSASALLASLVATPSQHGSREEIQVHLLEALSRDALGDLEGASTALERALDMAEVDGVLLPFLLFPASSLLERQVGFRTKHAALVGEVQNLLSGAEPRRRGADSQPLQERLSPSELRVLRYLPTNMQVAEIARELSVSVNTVRTHMRRVYSKLGVHRRNEAVRLARELSLLAPSSPRH